MQGSVPSLLDNVTLLNKGSTRLGLFCTWIMYHYDLWHLAASIGGNLTVIVTVPNSNCSYFHKQQTNQTTRKKAVFNYKKK